MYKCVVVMILLLLAGCANRHLSSSQSLKTSRYTNPNRIGMSYGGKQIVKDKPFKLQIPTGLKNVNMTNVGYSFLQVLNFMDDQKIVVLYTPNGQSSNSITSKDMPHKAFIDLCKQENIIEELKETLNVERGHFNLFKPNAEKFYIMYLNVKDAEIDNFTYSINSVKR